MDDTRIDLSEERGQVATTGHGVQNVPQQQQSSSSNENLVNDSTSASTSSTSSSISTVIQQDVEQSILGSSTSNQGEGQVPEISVINDDGERLVANFSIFILILLFSTEECESASTSNQQNDPDRAAQDVDEGAEDAVSSEGEKSSSIVGVVEVNIRNVLA